MQVHSSNIMHPIYYTMNYVSMDGLVQDYSNSSALAIDLLPSCDKSTVSFQVTAGAPSQYPKRRLSVRSRKVSKPRDLYLESMCLSNFKAIRQFKVPISWLRDFTRSYEKTSFRILRRGPVAYSVKNHRLNQVEVLSIRPLRTQNANTLYACHSIP